MDLEEEARKKKAADEEYSRRIKNQIRKKVKLNNEIIEHKKDEAN